MTTRAEAVAEAIKKRIRESAWPESGVLPPLRALAREFACSVTTAQQAIVALRKAGLLWDHLPRGSRTRLTGGPEAACDPAGSRLPYERLADRLRAEILRERFPSRSTLPTLKEIMAEFGGSHPTVRRALRRLEQEGYIEGHGRGFRIRRGPASPPNPYPLVVVTGRKALWGQSGFVQSFCRALEAECMKRRWPAPRLKQDFRPHPGAVADTRVGAGYIGIPTGDTRGWAAYFNRQPGIPYVLVNLMEEVRSRYRRHALFFRLMPDNRGAGREVALHLKSRGYARCVLFSTIPMDQSWARLRMEGLQEVFAYPGIREDSRSQAPSFSLCLPSSAPHAGLPEARRATPEYRAWIDALGRRDSALSEFRETFEAAGIRDVAGACAALWPHLERAFAECGAAKAPATAWVGINDFIAALLLAYLRHRLPTARRIAVCGFDDSPIALSLGITSFDLGASEFASASVRALTEPGSLKAKAPDGSLKIAGALRVRSSG